MLLPVPTREVVWTVVPVSPPAIHRPCPRCGVDRPFASTGCFRVNASGRKLDVWLVYACPDCPSRYKRVCHERVSPQSLGVRLEAYHANDADLAFATALSPCHGQDEAAFRVDGSAEAPCRVRIALPQPFAARLDRVLASGLGVSRSRVVRLVEQGLVGLTEPRALRRDVREGDTVIVQATADERSEALGDRVRCRLGG